jgi:hypothetical protein
MKQLFCACLLLTTAYVESGLAQAPLTRSLELSLSESISYYSKKNFQIGSPQSSTPIDGDMQIQTNNRHEVRFNFLTSRRFGSEAFYGYESTTVNFNRSTAPADKLTIPMQIHHFGVNLLYYPLGLETSAWRPL